ANELHVEVPHVQNAAASLAHYSKGLLQNLVQNGIGEFQALLVQLSFAVEVGIRLVGNLGKAVLDLLTELVSLGAQLLVGKLLHLRLERIDRQNARHQSLDLALVLGAKNL